MMPHTATWGLWAFLSLWAFSQGADALGADALPGWKGETAFLYSGFLTDEECDHIVWLDEIISRIEDRIAAWTFLPKENGEAIQVLHYEYGQKYDAHFDYFHDKVNQALGGHRIATVLMYLSHVKKGGETVFPSSELGDEVKDDTWSECAKRGKSVKPKKGDALLFFSLHPDATPDESSLHSGCPVIEGDKWSATKWIHVGSFDTVQKDPSLCEDDDPRCGEWAAAGECQKNPAYMVGTSAALGSCRKSCDVCNSSAQ
eukprot:jgi/Mesen1/4695/ME000241S03741